MDSNSFRIPSKQTNNQFYTQNCSIITAQAFMKNHSQNPISESMIYQYHNNGELNLHESYFDQTMNEILQAQKENQSKKDQNAIYLNQQQAYSDQNSFNHNQQNVQFHNYQQQNIQYQQQNYVNNNFSAQQQYNNQQQGAFFSSGQQPVQYIQNQQQNQQTQNIQFEQQLQQQQYQQWQEQQQQYQQQSNFQNQNNQYYNNQELNYINNNNNQQQQYEIQNQQNNQYQINQQYSQYNNYNANNTQDVNNQEMLVQNNQQQNFQNDYNVDYQQSMENNLNPSQQFNNEAQNQEYNCNNSQYYVNTQQNESNQFNSSKQNVINQIESSNNQPIQSQLETESCMNSQILYQQNINQFPNNINQNMMQRHTSSQIIDQSLQIQQFSNINQHQQINQGHLNPQEFQNYDNNLQQQQQNYNLSSNYNQNIENNYQQLQDYNINQTNLERSSCLPNQIHQEQSRLNDQQYQLFLSQQQRFLTNQFNQNQQRDGCQSLNQNSQFQQSQIENVNDTVTSQTQNQNQASQVDDHTNQNNNSQIFQKKMDQSFQNYELNSSSLKQQNSNLYQQSGSQQNQQDLQISQINKSCLQDQLNNQSNQEQINNHKQDFNQQNQQNQEQFQGQSDIYLFNLFEESYVIQYGKHDKKKKIKIEKKQFQPNEINLQFLRAIHELTSEDFNCSKYYKKNKNKTNQLQTLIQYGEEQYPHNKQKSKQFQNIYEENQDSFNYILDLRRGDHSFFRTTMTGFLFNLFNEEQDEQDYEQDELIKQIFIKLYYTECSDIALLEKPFDGISDLNLSINYKTYFLNCILYLFAHRFSDYSDSYTISELLKMCYKDDAFDFAMICFGISLCNNEMLNLQNDKDFSQFFDNSFGQIDCYQFEMNEIYQQALAQSLQVGIRSINLTVDQKERQKFKVEEELIITGSKEIIFNIKMIKHDSFYKLIFDQREERNFKYAQKKAQKADQLNENKKLEKINKQEMIQCFQCGKQLEFGQEMHNIFDINSKQEFCFCMEHIYSIQSTNQQLKTNLIKYSFQLLGNTQEQYEIYVDKIKVLSIFNFILNKNFPKLKTQCYFCKNINENQLIDLVTSSKDFPSVICLNCAQKNIKESNCLKNKYLKFKNLFNKDDEIITGDLFKNFILRESQIQQNCQCCQKNLKKTSKSFYIEDQYISLNLCEECLKQPLIKLERLNIQIYNKHFQQKEKTNQQVIYEQKLSKSYQSQQQFSKIQNDQELNKQEINKSFQNFNNNQSKIQSNEVNNDQQQQQQNNKLNQQQLSNQIQHLREDKNKEFQTQNLKQVDQDKKQMAKSNLSLQDQYQNIYSNPQFQINNDSKDTYMRELKQYQNGIFNQTLDQINLKAQKELEMNKIVKTYDYGTRVDFLKNPQQINQNYKNFDIIKKNKTQQQDQQLNIQDQKAEQIQKKYCKICANNNDTQCQALLIDLPSIIPSIKQCYCLKCFCNSIQSKAKREFIYKQAYNKNLFYCYKCGYRFTLEQKIYDLIQFKLEQNVKQQIECSKCSFLNFISVHH